MASASKRRNIRPRVSGKARPAAAPLDALRDPIRKQEVDRKRADESTPTRPSAIAPLMTAAELIDLMNRRTGALAELSLRIASSRTPFEAWRHQDHFMRNLIDDVEAVTLHMMRVGLASFPR